MNDTPTITWSITSMDCYPRYESESNVVFNVHWDCLGHFIPTTGSCSGSVYNSRSYGVTSLTYQSGSAFTPYNELTQPQVLVWIFDSMGEDQKNQIETATSNLIYAQINPPVVTLPLPWQS
jgi:hypothetical protein